MWGTRTIAGLKPKTRKHTQEYVLVYDRKVIDILHSYVPRSKRGLGMASIMPSPLHVYHPHLLLSQSPPYVLSIPFWAFFFLLSFILNFFPLLLPWCF